MQRRNVRVSVLEKICDAITPITLRIIVAYYFIFLLLLLLLFYYFLLFNDS